MDIATQAVTFLQAKGQSELSLAMVKQNADFQRKAVESLIETLDAVPAAPAGMGTVVDQYA